MKTDNRISKDVYYLNIARQVAMRGTCLRRNYGAVIVKNDKIVSTGYTGAPRGRANCNWIGKCIRMEKNVPSGERYELCRSVHAEMNAIISASSEELKDSTLYLYGWDVEHNCEKIGPKPCTLCERMIINAEIKNVVTFDPDDKEGYGKENVNREVIVTPVGYYITNDPSYKDLNVWKTKDRLLCHVTDESNGFDPIK